MSSSSSAKKVRKAARTGKSGGPKRSRERSLAFPLAITSVCIVGLALVAVSRADRTAEEATPTAPEAEFSATYGIYDCTEYLATSLPDSGAGAEFTIPLTSEDANRNGRLDRWGQEVGLELSSEVLKAPGLDPPLERAAGDDCEGDEGSIFLTVWSTKDADGAPLGRPEVQTIAENPGAYRPRSDDVIAIVFAPEGTEVDEPPAPVETGSDNSDAGTAETGSETSDAGTADTGATNGTESDTTPTDTAAAETGEADSG